MVRGKRHESARGRVELRTGAMREGTGASVQALKQSNERLREGSDGTPLNPFWVSAFDTQLQDKRSLAVRR